MNDEYDNTQGDNPDFPVLPPMVEPTPELHEPARWSLSEEEREFVTPFIQAAVQLREQSENDFRKALRLALRLKGVAAENDGAWQLVGDKTGELYLVALSN